MSAPRLDARGAEISVVPNLRDVAGRSASLLIATLADALRDRAEAHVALTGGSTPGGVFRLLSAPRVRERLDWSRVHLWWGDDRYVPRGDPLCNVYIADTTLFSRDGESGIPIPEDHVHPFPTTPAIEEGRGAEWCAAEYAAQVRSLVPAGKEGWPRFDLMLVGIGPDAHLLSVFPDSAAFDSDRLALAIPAPTHVRPHVPRVTLNPAVVTAAASVLAMVHGASKAETLERILGSAYEPRRLPAQLALRPGATWVVDAAAASRIAPALARSPAEDAAGR